MSRNEIFLQRISVSNLICELDLRLILRDLRCQRFDLSESGYQKHSLLFGSDRKELVDQICNIVTVVPVGLADFGQYLGSGPLLKGLGAFQLAGKNQAVYAAVPVSVFFVP